MKMLLAMLFAASIAFASPGDVHLVCDNTTFSDLVKIEVVEDQNGELVVVETNGKNQEKSISQVQEALENGSLELSDWYGYSRTLVRSNDGSWSIEHRDECSGGISRVTCR